MSADDVINVKNKCLREVGIYPIRNASESLAWLSNL